MFEHPTTSDGGSEDYSDEQSSTVDQGSSPNQDDTTESGSETPTLNEEVDIEALKAEKRAAVTEAKKRFHEEKAARAEVSTLRSTIEKSVQSNPDLLLQLQQDDPVLADDIANKLYGASVDELVAQAEANARAKEQPNTSQNSREDIRKIMREEREAEERKTEKVKIDRLEVDFFLENDIDPKGDTFKSIMQTYNKFKPKTFDEAQEILEMAFAKTKHVSKKTVGNIGAVYSPGSGSVPTVKKKAKNELSASQKELGKMLGISSKYLT